MERALSAGDLDMIATAGNQTQRAGGFRFYAVAKESDQGDQLVLRWFVPVDNRLPRVDFRGAVEHAHLALDADLIAGLRSQAGLPPHDRQLIVALRMQRRLHRRAVPGDESPSPAYLAHDVDRLSVCQGVLHHFISTSGGRSHTMPRPDRWDSIGCFA